MAGAYQNWRVLLHPLSHENFDQVGQAAFAYVPCALAANAKVAAGTGVAGQRVFMENAMRDISTGTTLCRVVARRVCSAAPV